MKMKLDKDILKAIFIFPVSSQKCQLGSAFSIHVTRSKLLPKVKGGDTVSIYYYKVKVTIKDSSAMVLMGFQLHCWKDYIHFFSVLS